MNSVSRSPQTILDSKLKFDRSDLVARHAVARSQPRKMSNTRANPSTLTGRLKDAYRLQLMHEEPRAEPSPPISIAVDWSLFKNRFIPREEVSKDLDCVRSDEISQLLDIQLSREI